MSISDATPRTIDRVILHCSATPKTRDIGAKEIRLWHRARGWSDIGYHYVIRRDGALELGRDEAEIGAHCRGFNHGSIGVCLIGGVDRKGRPQYNFTESQRLALVSLLKDLTARYPVATLHGHNEFSEKACPSFDVTVLAEDLS